MKRIIFIFLISLFSINIMAQTNNLIVAVSRFDNYSKSAKFNFLEPSISDAIINSLHNLEGISIIDRTKFDKVMQGLNISVNSLKNDIYVKKVGEQISADFVVVGKYIYNPSTDIIRIDARIVSVKSVLIVDSETVIDKSTYSDDLQKNIANKITKFFKSSYNLSEKMEVKQETTVPVKPARKLVKRLNYKQFVNLFYIDLQNIGKTEPINQVYDYKSFVTKFYEK